MWSVSRPSSTDPGFSLSLILLIQVAGDPVNPSQPTSTTTPAREEEGEGEGRGRVRRTGGSWASLQLGAKPSRSLAARKSSGPSNHHSLGLGQDDAPSARPLLKRGHSEELAVATRAGAGSSHQRTESTEASRALSRFGDLAVSLQKVVQGFLKTSGGILAL